MCMYIDTDTGPLESGKILLLFLCFGINKFGIKYITLKHLSSRCFDCSLHFGHTAASFSLLVFVSFKAVHSQCRDGLHLTSVSQCQWSTHVLDLGYPSLKLIFVLYRSDGLSCRDCGWCVGCGFFKLVRGRRNQYYVGRPRTSAFQHTCVKIQSL